MLTFWLIAAAMTALVLVLLVPALLRTPETNEVDQQAQDVAIARYRLQEMDQMRERGEISETDYAASRAELEASLAQDIAQLERSRERASSASNKLTPGAMWLPVAIAFAMPVAAGALYLVVGTPGAVDGSAQRAAQAAAEDPARRSIDVMMDQLKQRLAENPDDARGWNILARTSMQLQRYDDAAMAFERLNSLTPDNPEILVQYADALAMQAGGDLSGKPTQLLEQALRLDPEQPQGLWLAGMAAERRGEYELAYERWTRLLPRLEGDPESRDDLVGLISDLVREARSAGVGLEMPEQVTAQSTTATRTPAPTAGAPGAEATSSASLTVQVSLAEELAGAASPSDTVFVFARAVGGPPMPVAAARRQVSDLPFAVTLDDTQAMVPTMKLSAFDRVNLVARVSKSGQPTAASGDLEGVVEDVATDASGALQVVISRRVP